MHPDSSCSRPDSGFTLVELLVVVLIIGILAVIAIPAFMSQRERAWQTEVQEALRNTALEIEGVSTQTPGSYPATVVQGSKSTYEASTRTLTITKDRLFRSENISLYYQPLAHDTHFSLCATHVFIVDAAHQATGHMIYNSDGGGLVPWSEDGDCESTYTQVNP